MRSQKRARQRQIRARSRTTAARACGHTADAITATQKIVSAWPDGKRIVLQIEAERHEAVKPISSSSRGRRRPRKLHACAGSALPMARLARKASDASRRKREQSAIGPNAPSPSRAPISTTDRGDQPMAPLAQIGGAPEAAMQSRLIWSWKIMRRPPVHGEAGNAQPREEAFRTKAAWRCLPRRQRRCQIRGFESLADGPSAGYSPAIAIETDGGPLEEPMDFDYSPRQKEWMKRVGDFMDAHIYPAEADLRRADGRGAREGQSLDRRAGRRRTEEEGQGRRACGISFSTRASMARV